MLGLIASQFNLVDRVNLVLVLLSILVRLPDYLGAIL